MLAVLRSVGPQCRPHGGPPWHHVVVCLSRIVYPIAGRGVCDLSERGVQDLLWRLLPMHYCICGHNTALIDPAAKWRQVTAAAAVLGSLGHAAVLGTGAALEAHELLQLPQL